MKYIRIFCPEFFRSIGQYNIGLFRKDLTAGLTVGVVALPLAMAFAIASGLSPEAGLFTAIVAGFIISFLGGSKVQIGGPTGAFIIIVSGILIKYGPVNLAICTMMAGVILILMGIGRMGGMIKFIPYPITMGFTSGIAVLILSTQIKDFLGLNIAEIPFEFIPKMMCLMRHLNELNPVTFIISTVSFLIILFWPKSWSSKVPSTIVAMLIATLAVVLLDLDIETIGSRFGDIPRSLPGIEIPQCSWDTIGHLIKPALTIAILAAIESLLSAVVADGMIESRHDSNQELVAQGLANFIAPLFGGIPATGAIARTATNVRSGGKTPVSGMVHSVTLLVIMMVAAPIAVHIPLAALSAVLVSVALRMGEWHHFVRLLRWPVSDAIVFLTAFLLTVLVDLTVAVEVGMVLAAMLFLKRIADSTEISKVDSTCDTEGNHHSLKGKNIPDNVLVFRIFGSFSFGVADRLETALERSGRPPEVIILRLRKVVYMDATGLNALEDLLEKLQKRHASLILVAPAKQPIQVMTKAGFIDRVGSGNITADIDAALDRSRQILAK